MACMSVLKESNSGLTTTYTHQASSVALKKEQSGSSLGGEPIDLKNPPYHFRYPPGSGTESDVSVHCHVKLHMTIM